MPTRECPACACLAKENYEQCPVCGYEFPVRGSIGKVFVISVLLLIFALQVIGVVCSK